MPKTTLLTRTSFVAVCDVAVGVVVEWLTGGGGVVVRRPAGALRRLHSEIRAHVAWLHATAAAVEEVRMPAERPVRTVPPLGTEL